MPFYFVIILLLVIISASIDAMNILDGKSIDHKKESFEFGIYCIIISLSFYHFGSVKINFILWILYCIFTTLIVRTGWFDFLLNVFRGKSPFYISKNADGNYTGTKESKYDDFLHKIKINANYVRVISFVLSIIWFFYFK